ncbi:MAG TPA: hypothetical protein VI548_02040 [Chitinophagaceae bacterium]|nr:hypothetical protein [Chitinophagaceae bacterium]
MKKKVIAIRLEEALIYKQYYRPSLNLLRFLRTIAGVFISGQTQGVSRHFYRRK